MSVNIEEWDTYEVCDCCAFWYVNKDDSGCRDYWEHTHPVPDLGPDSKVIIEIPEEEPKRASFEFICPGCCETVGLYGNVWTALVDNS